MSEGWSTKDGNPWVGRTDLIAHIRCDHAANVRTAMVTRWAAGNAWQDGE